MTHKIIWLASYPKSGNTWVRALLANLFWPDPAGPLDINKIGLRMLGDGRQEMFAQVTGKPVADLTVDEVHAARAGVQKLLTEMGRTQFVKTHSVYCKEAGHDHIVPSLTEGAIYIVRDPRDVVLSVQRHFGKTAKQAVEMLNEKHMALGADEHRRVWNRLSDWSTHVKSWSGLGQRCCLVRYEDLQSRSLATMQMLCQWGGLTFTDDQINRALEHTAFKRMAAAEAENGFIEATGKGSRFFRSGQVGGWRKELPWKLVRKIERAHGPTMRALGYKLS
jgi:hypothetical protein